MNILGYEITIKKKPKEIKILSNEDLRNKACDKLLGKRMLISGICGDVERGRIIGFKCISGDEKRYVHFNTDNEEYPVVRYSENEITEMKR